MSAEVKRCVFCGGDDHPDECGRPADEDFTPWVAYGLLVVLPGILVAGLIWEWLS